MDESDEPAAYITGAELGFVGLHVEGAGAEGPVVSIGLEAAANMPVIKMSHPNGGHIFLHILESGEAAIYLEDADGTRRVISTQV